MAQVIRGGARGRAYTDDALNRRTVGAYLDLVRNGGGILANNDNFSQATFVGTDMVSGGGSFDVPAMARFNPDDPIAVDPYRPYRLSAYVRALQNGNPTKFYMALDALDVDKQSIIASHWLYKPGTLTTLTAPLKPGDTVVQVASTANWNPVTDATSNRGILPWGYRNSRGYLYPPETYSRHSSLSSGNTVYIAMTDTSVTLDKPWVHPEQPAGTPISNGLAGSVYLYLGTVGPTLTTNWTKFEGTTQGVTSGGNRESFKLPSATAFVQPTFLYTQTPFRINMVQLSEIL